MEGEKAARGDWSGRVSCRTGPAGSPCPSRHPCPAQVSRLSSGFCPGLVPPGPRDAPCHLPETSWAERKGNASLLVAPNLRKKMPKQSPGVSRAATGSLQLAVDNVRNDVRSDPPHQLPLGPLAGVTVAVHQDTDFDRPFRARKVRVASHVESVQAWTDEGPALEHGVLDQARSAAASVRRAGGRRGRTRPQTRERPRSRTGFWLCECGVGKSDQVESGMGALLARVGTPGRSHPTPAHQAKASRIGLFTRTSAQLGEVRIPPVV